MVVFTCGHCGESVQKPKVEKHYLTKCRNRNPNLSCMDCFKDFLITSRGANRSARGRRGGGGRTRGGIGRGQGEVDAVSTEGMEPVRFRRPRRSRGARGVRGARSVPTSGLSNLRQDAISMSSLNTRDMVEAPLTERALHIRRPRQWPVPSQEPPARRPRLNESEETLPVHAVDVTSPQPITGSGGNVGNEEVRTVPAMQVASSEPSTNSYGGGGSLPPSAGLYLELTDEPAPSRPSSHRPLRDNEIENIINFGSENESDDDDDDEERMLPIFVPRVERSNFWDDEALIPPTTASPPPTTASPPLTTASPPPTTASPPPTTASPPLTIASPTPTDATPPPPHSTTTPPTPTLSSNYQPSDFYDFQWRQFPNPPIPVELRREQFSEINTGSVSSYAEPCDAFMDMWNRSIMEHICAETNRYAQQTARQMEATGRLYSYSRIRSWQDIKIEELYVYFAIVLAMGVVVKTRTREYFSDRFIFRTPGFPATMSSRRFEIISKCLHFTNNDSVNLSSMTRTEAKLYKVQPIIDHLNERFSSMYVLNQNVAIDESLTQWKGWLDINHFMPNKAAAIGIKTYEVCESQSGYLWRFEVHSGSNPSAEESSPISGMIPATVLRLVRGLENKGHTLWMDNYYNSPALARFLKTRGFDCVGTLRTNRQFVPNQLATLTKAQMFQGQVEGCTSGDVDLMVWRDKNLVGLISTYHGNTVTRSHESTLKPSLIMDYNLCMGGVDKKDQMLSMYPIERKRTKIWYKKFFRRLLNVSVLNAYILYKHTTPGITHREFRFQLIEQLLSRYHAPRAPLTSLPDNLTKMPSDRCFLTPAQQKHYAFNFPTAPGSSRPPRKTCKVCKQRTQTYCPGCNVALCAFNIPAGKDCPCFTTFHSVSEMK